MIPGIEINGEMLELAPGTVMELAEENPFLQFAEENTIGNYSLPIELLTTEKNLRLTGYAGVMQKKIDVTGIPNVRLYGNGIQHSIGRLKIEKGLHNINYMQRGKISAYYLTGSSDFYQEIKGKQLKDIDVGGDRTFAWDAYASGGAGFWGHITTVIRSNTPQNYDYCFFPVLNREWGKQELDSQGTAFASIMNDIRYEGGNLIFKQGYVTLKAINTIVPFPWLHYVMKQAAAYAGWKIKGDILQDADFLKICMINFQAIDWGWAHTEYNFGNIHPHANVTFNLQDHLPDVTIADFFLSLRKRFGWWYDFNFNSRTITIRKLYDAAVTEVKDLTEYASPLINKNIKNEADIYSLKNIFSTSLADGQPGFLAGQYQGAVNDTGDLPAVDDSLYGKVYLVRRDNNYYICTINAAGNALEWQFYTYNIYDYIPDGATKDITTAATTLGVEKYPADLLPDLDSYLDLLPSVDYVGNWTGRSEADANWGVILCFSHGRVNNQNGNPYCYGSSHIYDSSMNQVAQWALTFTCEKTDGSDVGLYALNWKPFLDILSAPEEFESILSLPFHLALQLKFSDRIVINGVMMFVKQIKRNIPYQGSLSIEAIRIL